MPVLGEMERRALASVDESLSGIQRALEQAAASGALDHEGLERMVRTFREAAGRVNRDLPPQVDAQAADEIRRRLLALLTLDLDSRPPLDLADDILVEMEAVRHVVRDLLDEQPPVELRDARRVLALLEAWLPGASLAELAALVGYSPRQVQRLRQAGGAATHRAQVVVRLVALLRHAWTDRGVIAWFYRPRRDLDGSRPVDLVGEPAYERDLILAARAGRAQGAA